MNSTSQASCWTTFATTSSMRAGMLTCEMALASVIRVVRARASKFFEDMGCRVDMRCQECWAESSVSSVIGFSFKEHIRLSHACLKVDKPSGDQCPMPPSNIGPPQMGGADIG